MRSSITKLMLLLGAAGAVVSAETPGAQAVLAPSDQTPKHPGDHHDYVTEEAQQQILQTVKAHLDPVDAYLALRPEAAAELAERRLLHVSGEQEPEWMTVGDKMRLRRKGKKFMDVTDYQDVYAEQVGALAGKASMFEAHGPRSCGRPLTELQNCQTSRISAWSSLSSLSSRLMRCMMSSSI